ncbi:putative X protein [Hubei diptera virus 10]|uniref:Putative X protein n=1 Tax=Hubei diptera virus 10 TaxID=1922871 RepID=A0A1L3KN11_9RHAB|nr:putative X protein [Hubei diptera virus 10]APG78753.1 putative X protein [Hubei diptera virus 10]
MKKTTLAIQAKHKIRFRRQAIMQFWIIFLIFPLHVFFEALSDDDVYHIVCTTNNSVADKVYSGIVTEYSTRVKLTHPFTISQWIHLDATYNESYQIVYDQYCEVDDEMIGASGFLADGKISSAYKKVVAKIKASVLYLDQLQEVARSPGFEEQKHTISGFQSRITEDDNRSSSTEIDDGSVNELIHLPISIDHNEEPITETTTLPAPHILNGQLSVLTNHAKTLLRADLRRAILENDQLDGLSDDDIPDGFIPSRSRFHRNIVKSLLKRSNMRAKRSNPMNKPNDLRGKIQGTLHSIEIMKKRIYHLETKWKQTAFLLSYGIRLLPITTSSACKNKHKFKFLLRCYAKHYDIITSSSEYHNLVIMFLDLADKEGKLIVETSIYDNLNKILSQYEDQRLNDST